VHGVCCRRVEPVTYDNLSRGDRWALKWGPLEIGDVADEEHLREVLDRHRPIAIVHFAAFAYVAESVENPNLYYQNDACGSASRAKASDRRCVVLDIEKTSLGCRRRDHPTGYV
jgi:UDP-glucose 4-epimerase